MSLPCPGFESLSAYRDGELDEEQARRLDEHVLGCGDCRERLRRLHLLRGALGPSAPAPDLLPEIMAGVARASRTGVAAWRALPLAVAASLAIWGGVLLGHSLTGAVVPASGPFQERMRLFGVAPPGALYRRSQLEVVER